MSTSPFAADPSTRRLLDEDYCLTFEGSHLIVEHIPYVTPAGAVAYGRLALPVIISGEVVQDDAGDHRIWFIGQQPFDERGNPLPGPSPEAHAVSEHLVADFMISSKPRSTGVFNNMYDKITSYVRVLSHPATVLDSSVTARPGSGWTEIPDDLPFVYADTGTARAGLAEMNAVFRGHRIGIIGLGGTGSYILDQVAKTWVERIELFDGDQLDNHNAFRAPGAADLTDLATRPNKAEYFARQYSRMHTGITAHPTYLTAGHLDELAACTFVFMAAADADEKPAILAWLRARNIPTIEVGMGIRDENGRLSGLVATVNHRPDRPEPPVSASAGAANEYDRNIQVADLNSLNAMLAVISWKKQLGYYAGLNHPDETVYKLFTGEIRNGFTDADSASSEEAA